ncbi:hypothetical protein, partial [Sphingomonas sp.]|uniref:hypothetical protein n=1 Tax=Sphingomonas sp. TaxID=28214 RepID=UPI0031CE169C
WWAWLSVTYAGVPIVQSTISPKSSSGDQWTTIGGQSLRESSPAILGLVNAWIMTRPAPLAQVIDVAATQRAADDGSGVPKLIVPPYSATGGGTLASALTTSTSATNTGAVLTGSTAPQVGEYLVIEPGTTNVETIYLRSVVDNGDGTWTVKGLGTSQGLSANFSKAHAAGVTTRTSYTTDGLHPAMAMHLLMAEPVKAAKTGAYLKSATLVP